MGTFTVISSTLNKCVSCKFYSPDKGTFLLGKCVSDTTQVKSRNRYHNSRACVSQEIMSNQEMDEKYGKN